jgi:DtxR family Mn-dependent transcriptional regulator
MAEPVTALIYGTILLVLAALIIWPDKGLMARWRRFRRSSRRELIEDALKHLYHCEYRNQRATTESLAGALSVSGDTAVQLIHRLQHLGLVAYEGEGVVLSDEGRSYALRIIRVHRLWERYLADETGVAETAWHQEAERQEHYLSEPQVDALSAQMGNPRFDPHGDPIPTAAGELPRPKGVALTALRSGELAEVIHVEDEPDIIYAQIVAIGLHPGTRIRVLAVTNESIHFEADGIENVLAPVAAANITVVRMAPGSVPEGPFDSLASLKPGEAGTVLGISRSCRGMQRRRLMDLGVVPGTTIMAEMVSASGDPTAYRVRGASVALRSQQARMVQIRRKQEG